jgi:secreted Zn-dependent insulinase-like peptidase
VTTLEIDPEVFVIQRDERIRRYRNTPTERPIDQTGWGLAEALDPTDWNFLEAATHLTGLTPEGLSAWREGVFEGLHVEVLAHGNLSADEAAAMGRQIQQAFPDAKVVSPVAAEIRKVPIGRELMRQVTVHHDDSAIRVLFQGDTPTLASQARWLMLGTLTKTPAFTQLRTEQQLGYVVWSGYDRRDMVPGLTVNIQSGVAHPQVLLERIDAFLLGMRAHLEDMTDDTYETVKQGLIAGLEEAPSSLNTRTRDLSRDLSLGVTTFDRKAQLVALLKELPKDDVIALLDARVLGDDARRYVSFAVGRTHADTPSEMTGCPDTACVVSKMERAHSRAR